MGETGASHLFSYVNISHGTGCWPRFEKASKAELSLCFNVWFPLPRDADICQCAVVLRKNKVVNTFQPPFSQLKCVFGACSTYYTTLSKRFKLPSEGL